MEMMKLDEAKRREYEIVDDCVSRSGVIVLIMKLNYKHLFSSPSGISKKAFKDLLNGAQALPSVTPTQKWIPVSERLPEENGNYLVTVEANDGTAKIKYQAVDHYGPKWLHDEKTRKVIAWMPLPKPYGAESEGKQ